MDNQPEKRNCAECEQPLFGRTDKKFCSDGCRNSFNNRVNSDATNFVRNVNNALRKNRRILMEINTLGQDQIHRDKLLMKGFDFDYFTSTRETLEGKIFHYCYDQGYLQLEEGMVQLLVKAKSN